LKRDMDLIRTILIKIESDNNTTISKVVNLDGYDPVEVSYHVKLLIEARLIDGDNMFADNTGPYRARCLTWDGHEFILSVRDDAIWNNIRSKVKKESLNLPFKVLATVAIEMTKQYTLQKFGLAQHP
jgi:hypothetical protein